MKTFLALLISCLTLSAATTYPVLTDSTNRLFPGGVTNVFFLNSNVVTTGTMRATGAVTLTNASNVFAGDGSGLTGISSVTNLGNGSGSVLITNAFIYSSGGTNRALTAYATNGTDKAFVTVDGQVESTTGIGTKYFAQFGNGGLFGMYTGSGYNSVGDRIWYIIQDSGSPKYYQVSGAVIGWSSSSSNPDSSDVAVARNSSGTIEVNSFTSGQFRDLVCRSLFATNLYATNLIINGGATVTKILSATATLNFDLTALTVEDLTITVTGAADGDVVTLGVPNGSVTTSVQYSAWVSAADTVTVRARTSATGENPASGVFRATIIKH